MTMTIGDGHIRVSHIENEMRTLDGYRIDQPKLKEGWQYLLRFRIQHRLVRD